MYGSIVDTCFFVEHVGSHLFPANFGHKKSRKTEFMVDLFTKKSEALLNIHIFDVPHTFAGCLCRFWTATNKKNTYTPKVFLHP